jgi:restriction endonuclease Mrr
MGSAAGRDIQCDKKRLVSRSETAIEDMVATNAPYVADHLRNQLVECAVDGSVLRFEIDSEQSPYVRLVQSFRSEVLDKLTRIDPYEFEDVCAKILGRLGAKSNRTQRTNDGGVDFIGVDLKVTPDALTLPRACRAAVIGQAKRYKPGRLIKETTFREFVSASALHRHGMVVDGKLWPLTPVIYAFWTTSDFEPGARDFGRRMGLWYMDGATLSAYIEGLGLAEYVLAIPDVQASASVEKVAAEVDGSK